MALKEIDKTIDGVKYKTVQFPTSEGIKITVRLTKVFGPVFDAIGSDKKKEMTFNASVFTEKLSDAEVLSLIKDLLQETYRNGTRITQDSFDIDFAGEYGHLYQVVLFVVDANNFFGKGSITKISDRLKSLKMSQILPKK